MASQEELQEQLKNMSPEEMAAFQKQNCIFCKIVSGEVPSKKVYEDDKCIGILDINPASPGHILLLPKEHFMVMPQMPEEVVQHMFVIAKQLSHALLRALKSEGTNIFVANGGAAGQRAQHFMIHIFPRNPDDGVKLDIPEKAMKDEEREVLKKQLTALAGQVLGKAGEEKPDAKEPSAKKKEEPSKKGATPEEKEDVVESTEKPEKEVAEAEKELKEALGDEEEKEEPEEGEEKEKEEKEDESDLDEIADFLTKK